MNSIPTRWRVGRTFSGCGGKRLLHLVLASTTPPSWSRWTCTRAKSGDEIEGQLFSFTDKGGREVALRPEMTPTVCRMVGAKASALKRPIKWFSIAEYYRYERVQKGRERAFFQFNADLFAEPGPEAEIELISLLVQCLRAFGLTEDDFFVRLSDRNVWFYYLEALGLDEARIRAVLTAVDKFEKAGPAGFRRVYRKIRAACQRT